MSWVGRLRNLFRADGVRTEIDREFAFHLAERADQLKASGMGSGAAYREARRRFGPVAVQRERTRERHMIEWLESVMADIRYAVRALRRTPAFTVVAVLSLAIGIGANTAIFSLIHAVMLRSLPVAQPEQLVRVVAAGANGRETFTNPMWEAFRDHPSGFQHVFAYSERRFDLSTGGVARTGWGDFVSGEFFPTLGLRAAAGRLLLPADDHPGCPAIVVLSDAAWQQGYGRDPAAVGKSLTLNGHAFQIVGVVSRGFAGFDVGVPSAFFVPLCAEAITQPKYSALHQYSTYWLRVIGRVPAGSTLPRLAAEVAQVGQLALAATVQGSWNADRQAEYRAVHFSLLPAGTGLSFARTVYHKALAAMMAVVLLTLLIACTNVANLLLARAASRRAEFALRLGLGAGRRRLLRQLLTESLVLAVASAALGLLFAWWASRALLGMMSIYGEPLRLDVGLDGPMLAFTLAVAVATALLFGMAPAWRGTTVDPPGISRGAGRGVVAGHSRWGLARTLIALQIAMSLALVAGAGLLVTTFYRLLRSNTGFRSEGVLVASVDLRYATTVEGRYPVIYRQLLERAGTIPGVSAAALAWTTPLDGSSQTNDIVVDGRAPTGGQAESYFNSVTPEFFAALGIPLLAGRVLADADAGPLPRAAVVNQAFVRRFFPGGIAVGHSYRTADSGSIPVAIVGVVADARVESLRDAPVPMAFLPLPTDSTVGSGVSLVVRSTIAPSVLERQLLDIGSSVDRGIGFTFRSLPEQVRATVSQDELLARLSAGFAVVALLLAAIGLYGLMSYDVARRRGEIGIRLALGASPPGVMRMVLRDVAVMTAVGVAAGLVLTLAAGHLIAGFLYGVAPSDPGTLAAAVGILALVALLAGSVPARRAARQDPMSVLREE
jgi:putative ABC transport system permease protein